MVYDALHIEHDVVRYPISNGLANYNISLWAIFSTIVLTTISGLYTILTPGQIGNQHYFEKYTPECDRKYFLLDVA